jgi:CDGSH iron-sulfur domain-containing protein 3
MRFPAATQHHPTNVDTIADMKISAAENGPYLIETSGEVVLTRGGSDEVIDRTVIALCRCGQSSNKPFCDGTHKAAEFGEPASEIVFGS